MSQRKTMERTIGLAGATGVGVGAIVGGGILALTGVAFSVTGPGAILAFALNGAIALLTVLSFAEMSARFPESGGPYTFAKKVLTIEAAFVVGWVVWFASIVAAVLYAVGFAAFAAEVMVQSLPLLGRDVPAWLTGRLFGNALAVAATLFYTFSLARRAAGGGQWVNIAKVLVFAILILGGFWAMTGESGGDLRRSFSPFTPAGAMGLFQAMGFTFIALQGWDLIAAVGGEVKNPGRNIPRSMLLSLGIALLVYLPLLVVVCTVGVPEQGDITSLSREHPETIVAVAARNYLGGFGYWLVLAAGILSMLSALQANLFAASRIALAMSRDRTLPHFLEWIHERRATPVASVYTTAGIIVATILVLPDVATAGAASSLIFLLTFMLAHVLSMLVRRRAPSLHPTFQTPLFPAVPVVGGLACFALAVFSGVQVPLAGILTLAWMVLGVAIFMGLFSHRARVVDAMQQASDPQLIRLRGRSPLVLAPIANPDRAQAMVQVANAITPQEIGRVLLLSVVVKPADWRPGQNLAALGDTQTVLRRAMEASLNVSLYPEALSTIAARPWPEIARVARLHRCESLLLGASEMNEGTVGTPLDELIGQVGCNVVVLRAPAGWELSKVKNVLVPIAGHRNHGRLRARLLSSLASHGDHTFTYLRVLPEVAGDVAIRQARRYLQQIARDETPGDRTIEVVRSPSAVETISEYAGRSDLCILGLHRERGKRRAFSEFTLRIARSTACPIIMINQSQAV